MNAQSLCAALTTVILLAGSTAAEQGSTLDSAHVSAFMGTWVLTMTNPAGATETVRIWDKNGLAAASVQAGRFPPTEVSGILKDGDMLVLTVTRLENGKPDRAVISLTLDGEMMNMAQMLEFSQ